MTILPQTSRREINWWLQQLEHLYGKQMGMSSVKETDASKTGWGQNVSLRTLRWGDHGVPQKKKMHINVLELKAVQFASQSLTNLIKIRS